MSTTDLTTRGLDRLITQLRGHIRTHRLVRPDRVVISTASRSVHAELTSGTGPQRLAGLLRWALTLEALALAWVHRPTPGQLAIVATGRLASGVTVGITMGATVTELGGYLLGDGATALAVLHPAMRLAIGEQETATHPEFARLLAPAVGLRGVAA